MCDFVNWLDRWQTLVAAAVALLAATWTIVVMSGQRRDETLRHHEQMRRRKLAARASMPDALSEISEYVRSCAERLTGRTDALPKPPVEAFAALKTAIEFIDDDAATRTYELASWYQVVRARLSSDLPHQGPNFNEYVYDLALLQAYVNRLYEYARNETDEVPSGPPSNADVSTGLSNALGLAYYVQHEDDFNGAVAVINQRHPAS